jgi:hypothetical protein
VSALREIERLVHGLETAEKEEYGKKVKEVVAVLHRVEQEEEKKQDDSTTVHSTDIPKVVIVPDQSDNHRPTEIPPEIQDLKSRLEESAKREQKAN